MSIYGVLAQPEWITSLSLNKALLLLFTMNKGCQMSAKTYIHIHANTIDHNNLIGVKCPFDRAVNSTSTIFITSAEVF